MGFLGEADSMGSQLFVLLLPFPAAWNVAVMSAAPAATLGGAGNTQ